MQLFRRRSFLTDFCMFLLSVCREKEEIHPTKLLFEYWQANVSGDAANFIEKNSLSLEHGFG